MSIRSNLRIIIPAIGLMNLLSPMVKAQENSIVLGPPTGDTINRNIYGHFAEHLGHGIYDGIYVGDTNKRIPNTAGVRNDIILALRNLNIPNLRWPGGCFADTYHWRDGVGPRGSRPRIVNVWWGGVTEDNSFGTHDFLDLCEKLGAQPYISGNVGSGSVQELSDWVQYTNFDGESPMSALRKANGHEKPWHVTYWGIGNEAWGCGGNMTAEYYTDEFRKFATFMSDGGGGRKIFRVASGANSGDYHWTETLMKNIPLNLLGGLGLHHYAVIDWNKKSAAAGFTETEYMATMISALAMDTLIAHHAAIMDRYDPKKKVALLVDEWGGWYDVEPGTNPGFLFQQNTMRDAVLAGSTLNIFNNHADRVRMANLAQMVNVLQAVILTSGPRIVLTPTYHVMEMYKVHQNAALIPVRLTCAKYILGDKSIPAISASASRDSLGRVHISLVNLDAKKAQTVRVNAPDQKGKITGSIISSPDIRDHNSFDAPEKIRKEVFTGFRREGEVLKVTLPPFSVVMLEEVN